MTGFRKRAAAAKLLESPNTLATTVGAILQHQFGDEVFDWDLTTVALEIASTFSIQEPAQEILDRFAALQTVMTTDVVFTRFDAFQAVCNAFNFGDAYFEVFDKLTMEEVAWGTFEIALNRETQPYAYATRRYVKLLLPEYGLTESNLPDILQELVAGEETGIDSEDFAAMLEIGEGAARNAEVLEVHIAEQLETVVAQFETLGELGSFEDWLRRRELLDVDQTAPEPVSIF